MVNNSLAFFVNRNIQSDNFRKMLAGQTPFRVMNLFATAGMGKSFLVRHFSHIAQQLGIPHVLLDFADRQGYDALELVRRFRDQLGPEHFSELTQAINNTTSLRVVIESTSQASELNANIAEQGQLGEVNIGYIAGGNIITDNHLILSTSNPLGMRVAEDHFNSIFFMCLQKLAHKNPVAILFDSYERLSKSPTQWQPTLTDDWIWNELLLRILRTELQNVVVVIAGRVERPFGPEWSGIVGPATLGHLTLRDVRDYLSNRRNLTQLTDQEVKVLFQASKGHPQLLATIGDNLAKPVLLEDIIW